MISLVNVTLARQLQDPAQSPLVVVAAGVGIGMASGAFNGFFVAVLRMQPIVVTLATMFILQGVTLLVMDKPGGAGRRRLQRSLDGRCDSQRAAEADRASRPRARCSGRGSSARNFGVAIYAVGSDFESAHAVGVRTRLGASSSST